MSLADGTDQTKETKKSADEAADQAPSTEAHYEKVTESSTEGKGAGDKSDEIIILTDEGSEMSTAVKESLSQEITSRGMTLQELRKHLSDDTPIKDQSNTTQLQIQEYHPSTFSSFFNLL